MQTERSWLPSVLLVGVLASPPAAADRLEVAATLPDLGSLIRTIGGDSIDVTVFAKGPQDPHFIEPRPSFIRAVHAADLFAQVGMDLEIGWAPVLLRGARNPRVAPGGSGHLDASRAIVPLEVPDAPVDRSMGDVHPYGNPHYLLDPVNGVRVAALIRDRLSELRPEQAGAFRQRYEAFAARVAERLVGPDLASGTDAEEVLRRIDEQTARGPREDSDPALGGWLGRLQPHRGTKTVEDHKLWLYFARRFGLSLVATLEPRPGIAPTSRHLEQVVELVRREGVPLILASPYFDPRHARWVAERTGARIARLAHQPGARPGTDDYLAMLEYNVRELLQALEGADD